MDVTDYRFASELLDDLLVVRLEHLEYVVMDLQDRGCYCEPFSSGAPRHAAIPKMIRLAPESLVGFLAEFDREVPRIRELPYLLSHSEEGTARYRKDFKYVRKGKIRCYSARNGTVGRTPGEPEVGGARLSHDQ